MRRSRALAVALTCAALLSACRSGDDKPEEPCPRVAVLSDAQRATLFRPGGRDLTDVIYEAGVTSVAGSCRYRDDGRARFEVEFVIAAQVGPAATGQEIEVPYFVAVTERNRRVIEKVVESAALRVRADSRFAQIEVEVDDIEVKLEGVRPRDLEILVGLQLAPDQVEFNRMLR